MANDQQQINSVSEVLKPNEKVRTFREFIKQEIFHLNFYRVHMTNFISVTLIASVIIYGEGLANSDDEVKGSKLAYIDALFLSCSAMTTTGLNTVNLGDLTGFQQAVLCLLLFIGSIPFVSMFVVVCRLYFFRRRLNALVKHSRAAHRIRQDIEERKMPSNDFIDTSTRETHDAHGIRQRLTASGKVTCKSTKSATMQRRSYQSGFGSWPAFWESRRLRGWVKQLFARSQRVAPKDHKAYLSFEPQMDERGRFDRLNEEERAEIGGVEYRALTILLGLLIAYQLLWIILGTIFLLPYSYKQSVGNVIRTSQPGNLSPGWWAFFSVITSWTNGGLNILNANFVPFASNYYILIVAGLLTIAGNTQMPVFLRVCIWLLSKVVPPSSKLYGSLMFLLHHPRRCFIFLFPARETWILFGIQVSIDISLWISFELLNIGYDPVTSELAPNVRTFDGLFQSTGVRKSGAYIITISNLAPALLAVYTIIMYISSYPIVLALRQTNTYEERSIGLDADDQKSGGFGVHLRNQLAYDIWFQVLAWVLLCIIERSNLQTPAPGFSIFSVMFEAVSAYGTVGLSTGVPYDSYSLAGAFSTLSKLVLLPVMLRGRHRGLPLAIDRSILIPGEELMHQIDDDYARRRTFSADSKRAAQHFEKEEAHSPP